jgi:ABC-type multidrug transport system permease subunit
MLGRPIVNKHRAFTFHRPGALWLGQIFVDTLFATVQITVFSIIVYFMCGLALDAGGFFTFVLVIVSGYLSMTLFFRTVGCLCPDFVSAHLHYLVNMTYEHTCVSRNDVVYKTIVSRGTRIGLLIC